MDDKKERRTYLLQTAKYFFNNIDVCFGSETPNDRSFIAIVLDGEDVGVKLNGQKDTISESISEAMKKDKNIRDIIVEACKVFAAYSLIEKFGGSYE